MSTKMKIIDLDLGALALKGPFKLSFQPIVNQICKITEILPPNGWCPGPGKVGQGGLKILHLWRHSPKTRTPSKNIFWV